MGIMESQIDSLKENWNGRSVLEKRILLLVAGLVICSLFYLLIFDPLVAWREQEKKEMLANNRVYTQVIRLVERFQEQQPSGEVNSDGLAGVIDKSLQENNLSMRGFQPGSKNDARLRLSNVTYDALVQWLYDVEYKHRLIIDELSVSQAKESGQLMVNVRVRKP